MSVTLHQVKIDRLSPSSEIIFIHQFETLTRSATRNTHREVTRIKVFRMIENDIWSAVWECLVQVVTRFDIIELLRKEIKLILEPWDEDVMKNKPQ